MNRLVAFQPEKSLDGFRGFLLGEAQVVEALQIVPQPRARAKEMSEAQGGVARYGACSIAGGPAFKSRCSHRSFKRLQGIASSVKSDSTDLGILVGFGTRRLQMYIH